MDNDQNQGNHSSSELRTCKKRGFVWFVTRGLACVVLLAVGGAVVLYALLQSEPEHWKQYQVFLKRTTPEQRETIVADVMAKIESLVYQDLVSDEDFGENESEAYIGGLSSLLRRDGESRLVNPEDVLVDELKTIQLTVDEMNAIVASQLPKWMSDRGYEMPVEIVEPMIAMDGEQLVLAFSYDTEYISQVFSAYFDLSFQSDGMAALSLSDLDAGRVPMPISGMADWVASRGGDGETLARARELGEKIGELEYFEFKPVLELKHCRRLRVQSLKMVGDDKIEITARVQDHQTYKRMNETLAAAN
ncbi:hypothetical protein [Poriferisphaera sp. WC338]|uniref:hypothetical protein n=1 Tax=Poriferisphaera sp. WC338 TaxID=3425129 RepID=UPI003D812C0F